MKFEQVLPLLKNGEKAFRLGWNGKGMFVVRQRVIQMEYHVISKQLKHGI